MNKKYLEVKEQLDIVNPHYFFDCSVQSTIDKLEDLMDRYKNKYHPIEIRVAWGGEDSPNELYLYGTRPETDLERDIRLPKAKKAHEKKEVDKEKKRQKLIKEAKKLGLTVHE